MGTIAVLNVLLGMNTTGFESGAKKGGAAVDSLASKISGLAGPLAGLLAGAASLHSIGHALEAAGEHAAAERNLNSVLLSTGNAVELTGGQLKQYAHDLQDTTRFAYATTVQIEAVLATFTQVKDASVFKGAIASAQDLSTILGQDLQSSIIQIGKALNDPVSGMTALKRVGVSFTEDQREQIKTLQKSGDTLGAQKLILRELATDFGGAAVAAGQGFGGQMARLKNETHELSATLGKMLTPFFTSALNSIDVLKKYGGEILATTAAVGTFAAAMTTVVALQKAWAMRAAILQALQGPKGWATLAISLVAAGAAAAYVKTQFDALGQAEEAANNNDSRKLKADAAVEAYEAESKAVDKARDALDKFAADEKFKLDTAGWTEQAKAVEKLKRALEAAHNYEGLNSAEVGRIEKAKALANEVDQLEKNKKIEEELTRFRKQAADAGLDSAQRQINALKELGATTEQLAKAEQIAADQRKGEAAKKAQKKADQQRKKDAADAKRLIESISPADKLKDQYKEIADLYGKGFLTGAQADKASMEAYKNSLKEMANTGHDAKPLGGGAYQYGTREAYQAQQAASRQSDPFKLLTEKQREQLTEMQKQTTLQRQMVAGLNVGQAKIA